MTKIKWMIENEEKVTSMAIESRSLCEAKFDVNIINDIILRKIELK